MNGNSKRKRDEEAEEEEEEENIEEKEEEDELVGLPAAPPPAKKSGGEGGVIFVLEKATLEVGKVGKTYQLLNCDDHGHFLRKNKKDPAAYRPDIIHQALLAVLDSPLNKAGRLSALYVQTQKNVLIEVNPHVRLPRTFKRFCGLMVQLLQKLSIRATNGPDKLLRVIKNPVTKHLPSEARRIGLSHSASKVVWLHDYVAAVNDKIPLVFMVGAMAHGKIEADYVDDFISISEYPLSAACCIGRICNAVEQKWKIL
uniref:TSA: Wollemia nobilis Ref_Wollemi_Transcript_16661_1119 transcribed RNA sequence n=1 Tax=Wollemia nobilis TaxID=56998 RepID=A0A0C9S2X7_9CONI